MKPYNLAKPNAAEFQRAIGRDYVNFFKSVKATALEKDNTPEDLDPRDGYVHWKGQASTGEEFRAFASIAKSGRASLTYDSEATHREAPNEGRSHPLSISKNRHLYINEYPERGYLSVIDDLSQNLTNADRGQRVAEDFKRREFVVATDSGVVVAEGKRNVEFLTKFEWSIAEYQRQRAALEG